MDIREATIEVGPFPVHLGNEKNSGKLRLRREFPYLLGLYFHARYGIQHNDGPVGRLKAVFGIKDEICIPGGIDQVDFVLVPFQMVERRIDRHTALNFLRFEVHKGTAVIHPPETIRGSPVKKHGFGQGGLAGLAVGDQGDIAQPIGFIFLHSRSLFLLNLQNILY